MALLPDIELVLTAEPVETEGGSRVAREFFAALKIDPNLLSPS